jgi:hypothetical protein
MEEHFALEVISLHVSGLLIMVITLQLWPATVGSNNQILCLYTICIVFYIHVTFYIWVYFCSMCLINYVVCLIPKLEGRTWGADFFRNQYSLDYVIATYTKPQVSCITS